MNTVQNSDATEAEKLRQSALRDLQLARELVNRARESMCNLEGRGYARCYAGLLKPYEALGVHARKIRDLKKPTGVFRW